MRSTMWKVGMAVLAAVCGLAAPVAAQKSFEGVIEFQSLDSHGKVRSTIVQTSKGSMLRMDMADAKSGEEGKGSMIVDLKTNTITILMAEEKRYMVMPMRAIPGVHPDSDSQKYGKITLESTGRTETVAGVECTIYHGTNTEPDGKVSEGDACLAKGLGLGLMDVMANRPGASQSANPTMQLFRKLSKEDLHALKVWEYKKGKPVVALEATKIERKSVPSSAFEIPEGYTKFTMPSMGGMPKP
jgi:hypothetical protein